jgi:hypothetical protein
MLSQKRDSKISEIKFGTKIKFQNTKEISEIKFVTKIKFQNTKETDYLIIKKWWELKWTC